ncbi:MAG: DedA family protein [Planctomycetes bacterium]|nr:DedA family protein [Planctomycetota bacterium]
MEWLEPYFEHGSYLAVFLTLILCGMGLPVPEEAVFLLAGFVLAKIDGSLALMMFVAVLGIMSGDSLTYYLGRRIGPGIAQYKWLVRMGVPARLKQARSFFEKHGNKTIFLAGFLAGVRAPTFFLCGWLHVSYYRFLLLDFLRAAITAPISIYLGYRFGPEAESMMAEYKTEFMLGIVLIVLGWIWWEIASVRKSTKRYGNSDSTTGSERTDSAPTDAKGPEDRTS